MSANAVLLWMSARQQGSWQQYRAAFEQLYDDGGEGEADAPGFNESGSFAPHHKLRFNLMRLGHAEFIDNDGRFAWRVAPPVLAVSTQSDGTWLAIAAGARSLPLLEQIQACGLAAPPEPHGMCPDVLILRSPDVSGLVSLADRAGMFVQRDAPAAILACVGPLDLAASSTSATLPTGDAWTFDRFCTAECRWVKSSRAEAEACGASGQLFQARAPHLKRALFCSRGSVREVAPAVGKYVALRQSRRHVLRYDREAGRLSAPASCRLPALIERALALCSGRPPVYEIVDGHGVIRYDHVTPSLAATVGGLLHQEIRP